MPSNRPKGGNKKNAQHNEYINIIVIFHRFFEKGRDRHPA
jgi:hypothetical protein